ncbi:MAG TPA: hypothetical protein VLX12_08925 [Syntrophorhabdales bacterium]|nr:hypothetical protein [Syntrophorhabdales bacterium]
MVYLLIHSYSSFVLHSLSRLQPVRLDLGLLARGSHLLSDEQNISKKLGRPPRCE